VAFTNHGGRFATGAADKRVKLWDTTGHLQGTLAGHAGSVTCVDFSKTDEYALYPPPSPPTALLNHRYRMTIRTQLHS